MNKIAKKIVSFKELKKGWDNYRALPIDEACIKFGLYITEDLTEEEIKDLKLNVTPLNSGALQFLCFHEDVEVSVQVKKKFKKSKETV